MNFSRTGLRLLSAFAVMGIAFAAQAEDKPKKKTGLVQQVSGQGYGMAGCGLGSILFGAQPGKIQIFAGTTNSIYGNQTFGISSGTSNCDIPTMGQQAAAFIEVNKEVVVKEAARGQGETVTAISVMLNCNEAELSEKLRTNLDHYFAQDINSFESVRRLMASGSCSTEG